MVVLIGGGLLSLAVAAAFVMIIKGVLSRDRFSAFNPEWLRKFSVAKYKPMERLLSEDDHEFLAAQPGYHPAISKRLRAERRRIFRGYLRALRRDFNRLETAARILMVSSPVDKPELAKALLRQRLNFMSAMCKVEFRLALHALGIGTVDVRTLVAPLDAIRLELQEILPASRPFAA